ncbi:hypothetical protein QJS66_23085 [Kocuria rhizophila]|nr:hypothetical protein QJS66_23085 [Kocuria rhizophila]
MILRLARHPRGTPWTACDHEVVKSEDLTVVSSQTGTPRSRHGRGPEAEQVIRGQLGRVRNPGCGASAKGSAPRAWAGGSG